MDRAQIPAEATAGAKLAQLRAESAFERLWRVPVPKHMTEGMSHAARLRKRRQIRARSKRRALRWLAEQLGLTECRFESFDFDTCMRVVDLCHSTDHAKVRAWSKAKRI